DWFEPFNWNKTGIPNLNYEVIIPNTPNDPFLASANEIAFAKKITLKSNAELTIISELNTNLSRSEIQTLLDNGETILDIMGIGVTPSSFIGLNYGGGIIFYIEADGTGLVAAPSDIGSSITWGCRGTTIDGADARPIGTGYQNTMDILAGCSQTGIAAEMCNSLDLNGYTDWFLPSVEEVEEMYSKIGHGAAAPNTNIGNFANSGIYWSSSESTDIRAFGVLFSSVDTRAGLPKDGSHRVRPIRAF
ncbi:MAG: DUF1566 domain-containing protein, partial [Bacteroidota bacterium]